MKAKIAAIWAAFKADMVDTWKRCKIAILAIGAVIVTLEFRKIMVTVMTKLGQIELDRAKKTDDKAKTQEDLNNAKADQIIQQADALPAQEQPVKDGWEKNT
jgi:hypothetical protein